MKIIIDRAALLRTLTHITSVVERRNTIPVLSNVLIDARGESIVMIATDLDIYIQEVVPGEIQESGCATVSAQTLFDIARKMPEGSAISLSVASTSMAVLGGRARFSLPTLPAEDFPLMDLEPLPNNFEMDAESFATLLGRPKHAMSNEETRYYLNGIFLHSIDGDLFAAATDGHRLVRYKTVRPSDASPIDGAIVPRKAVGELLKAVQDVEGPVAISLSDKKIRVELPGMTYLSKLIDGTFPDYNRVIPTANSKRALVSAKALAACIDRVSTIASEKTRAVKLELTTNRLSVSVSSPESGVATEDLEIEYAGEELVVGFNARYLLDSLLQYDDAMLELAFDKPASPLKLTRQGDADGVVGVLMPLRI